MQVSSTKSSSVATVDLWLGSRRLHMLMSLKLSQSNYCGLKTTPAAALNLPDSATPKTERISQCRPRRYLSLPRSPWQAKEVPMPVLRLAVNVACLYLGETASNIQHRFVAPSLLPSELQLTFIKVCCNRFPSRRSPCRRSHTAVCPRVVAVPRSGLQRILLVLRPPRRSKTEMGLG